MGDTHTSPQVKQIPLPLRHNWSHFRFCVFRNVLLCLIYVVFYCWNNKMKNTLGTVPKSKLRIVERIKIETLNTNTAHNSELGQALQ